MAEWISVKESLPEPGVEVLTYRARNGCLEVGRITYGRWWGEHYKNPITHWMPIPDAPKMVRGDNDDPA